MDQPWGLSGPEFTALYLAGFPLSVVLVLILQTVVASAGSRRAGKDVRLDVYQAAYLAGGPSRVLNTAIAGLALSGRVLVASGGNLTAIRGAAPADPIEAEVLQFLRPSAFRMIVVQRTRWKPAVMAVRDSVRSRGLVISGGTAAVWRLLLLLPVAVWVTGLVRAINGANLNRPIGNLTAELWLSGIALLVFIGFRVRAGHRPSAAGRAALRRLRREHRGRRMPTGHVSDAVWGSQVAGVALLGFTAISDPGLRSALVGTSGSSGGDSGGGDGGGGGGCGGGGCGG